MAYIYILKNGRKGWIFSLIFIGFEGQTFAFLILFLFYFFVYMYACSGAMKNLKLNSQLFFVARREKLFSL